jgi:diguanylate cyclase (GGDEF)-like protein
MAGTWLCAGALDLFKVGAAWLLLPEGDIWTVRGRARAPGVRIEGGIDSVDCHVIPLSIRGNTIGALALWPLPAVPDLTSEETRAYLAVLATALACRRSLEEQRNLVGTDPLTALANRRHLESALQRQMALARRNHRPLSLVVFDLDHFKTINERHGHDAGDSVLMEVARTLTGHVRVSDLPARAGGEAFFLVLPETALAEATAVAEKIRLAVERLVIPLDGQGSDGFLRITVSAGVTLLDPSDDVEELLARADQALHRAKDSGRNRCVGMTRNPFRSSPDA